MNRLMGKNGAYHAGFGAMRRTTRHRVAPVHALSSRTAASNLFVFVLGTQAPQGGAKAP